MTISIWTDRADDHVCQSSLTGLEALITHCSLVPQSYVVVHLWWEDDMPGQALYGEYDLVSLTVALLAAFATSNTKVVILDLFVCVHLFIY